jgi:ribosomal protein S27AE
VTYQHSDDEDELSLCPHCDCMTHTIDGFIDRKLCGKCGASKEEPVKTPQSVQLSSARPIISPPGGPVMDSAKTYSTGNVNKTPDSVDESTSKGNKKLPALRRDSTRPVVEDSIADSKEEPVKTPVLSQKGAPRRDSDPIIPPRDEALRGELLQILFRLTGNYSRDPEYIVAENEIMSLIQTFTDAKVREGRREENKLLLRFNLPGPLLKVLHERLAELLAEGEGDG